MSTTAKERRDTMNSSDPVFKGSLLSSKKRVVAVVLLVTALFVVIYAVYLSTVVVKSKGSTTNLIASASGTTLTGPLQGRMLPKFSLPSLGGGSTSLGSSYIAGRPAVVNFFASWCTSCQAEMSTLTQASKTYGQKVTFLGVDENDTAAAATKFLAKYGTRYPIAYDPKVSLAGPFQLVGLPTTLFVEPDGRIYREVLGTMSSSLLSKNLRALEEKAK